MKAHEHFQVEDKFYKAAGKEYAARAEACSEQDYEKMAECDKNLAKLLADHADHFKGMHCDAANKTAIDELNKSRNALESMRVSGVVPDNPTLRAVPRYGQKPVEKVDLDPEFAAIVGRGDDRTE